MVEVMEPHEDTILVVLGPRADFTALLKLLNHEAFAYNPEGLAAARAYDCIRKAVEAVIEESNDTAIEGELV